MKTTIVTCIALCVGLSCAVAREAPPKTATCVACHGDLGVSQVPQWPSLAGQNAQYLAAQLRSFRDGRRDNPAMAPFVAKLTEQEIVDLAAYYSSQMPQAAANGASELIGRGKNLSTYCTACHGQEGRPVADSWPNISGQQSSYIVQQLLAYQNGIREHPHMQVAVKYLSADDITALAAYYSQLEMQDRVTP